MVDLVSPSGWGARVDYDQEAWRPWMPDKWVIHWGGGGPYRLDSVEQEMALLRGWERYHIDSRGYRGIAYNYAVGQSGTAYRLRGENQSGATAGDIDDDDIRENVEGVAVVFMVGPGQSVSVKALETFQKMWEERPMPVFGHRDRGDPYTECPGDELLQWIQDSGYQTVPPVRSVFDPHIERWRPLVAWFIGENAKDMFGQPVVDTMLCIMDAESDGNPEAVNTRSGASGLFQHMPHLWPDNNGKALAWYGGVGIDLDDLTDRPQDPFDPVANIATTVWLLYAYSHGYWNWSPTHDGRGCGFRFPTEPTRMPGPRYVPTGPFPGVPGTEEPPPPKPKPRKVRQILAEIDERIKSLEDRVAQLESNSE